MWNAQNASHIHTASTAATGSNPMPNQNSTNNLPDFQFRKVRKKLDTTHRDVCAMDGLNNDPYHLPLWRLG